MKGLRSRVFSLVLAFLVVVLALPAAAADYPYWIEKGGRFYVQVTGYSPQRFLAGGDPNDVIEIEFSEPPGKLGEGPGIWDEPEAIFIFPPGSQEKVKWELSGTKLRVWSPGTGRPGSIIFFFFHIPWVRVAVAGDYMELTPAKFWGDGRVTLKVRVLRWPGGPPAANEEVVARVVCRENVGTAVKEGHMFGWPITLSLVGQGRTDSQGVAYVTLQFYERYGKAWLKAIEGLDVPIDLKPDRQVALVVFTRDVDDTPSVPVVPFQSWEEAFSGPGRAALPKAPVDNSNLSGYGPGGVSNTVLVTQEFLDRAFGRVRVVDDSPTPPPTDNLPDGTIIDRQPGYVALARPAKLDRPGETVTLAYDQSKLTGGRHPAVYYWHPQAKKWVGLASYPAGEGKVKAVNRGYSGWFAVFGVVRPSWTDTGGHWAEQTADRTNVLGLLEGYPAKGRDPLLRPAGLDRKVTRAEFTAIVARILGMNPGDLMYTALKPLPPEERDRVLARFKDAIPAWARDAVAAAVAGGVAVVRGDKYNADEPLTRIEAAAIISNALKQMPGWQVEDLAKFRDAKDVPAWAKGMIAQGVIGGYPDNTLRPNATLTRAEALTLVLRLLEALGW